MKVVGGVMKEVVHSYAKISPNVSVEGAETTKKERVIPFSGNPRRVVRIAEKRTDFLKSCAMASFKS
jgi:hypothetical protein